MKQLICAGLAIASAPLVAQSDTIQQQAPGPALEQAKLSAEPLTAAIAPSVDNILRAGTGVSVRLLEELTTERKAARVGQRFRMEVAEPLMWNGKIVIPSGSPVQGEISEVRNKGMWGKSGHITARVLYATVGGRQVRLSGSFDDKGVTGTAGVVGAIVFVPIAGFFVTGTSARIPSGSVAGAYLDEDITVVP